jgi:hypothetical protein
MASARSPLERSRAAPSKRRRDRLTILSIRFQQRNQTLPHHLSRFAVGAFAVNAALLVACTGAVGSPSPTGGAAGSSNGSTTSSPGAAGGGTTSTTSSCEGVHPGPSLVRRLNRFEYDNTVRDLLGDTTRPAEQFPTEERSHLGLDNDASVLTVSPVLVEKYSQAAESLAAAAASKLATFLPCDPVKDGEEVCGKAFVSAFGAKAFRRPLESAELDRLWGVLSAGRQGADFTTGARMVMEAVLQSPAFLYRVEFGGTPATPGSAVRLSSWEMASRLSYFLWQSMPDEALRAAAQEDRLVSDDAIAAQVGRMLADPKAHDMVAHFHEVWLHLDKYATLEKDAQIFPTFTPEIAGLMAQETHQFLDHVIFDDSGDVGALFTAPYSYMNAKLAAYYGVQGPTADAFVRVALDPQQRLGLLAQGGLLSALSKANQTGPVQRGKFVREQFFCMQMPPPPPGVIIKVPDLDPNLSTRERFGAHSKDPGCKTCHALMDPIGLALESLDGAGRYRATENGKPIDVSGEIVQTDVAGSFTGAAGLAQKLAGSETVKGCISTAWFQYAYGREQAADDACTISKLQEKFKTSGYKLKDLVVLLTQTDAFRFRNSIPAGGAQ